MFHSFMSQNINRNNEQKPASPSARLTKPKTRQQIELKVGSQNRRLSSRSKVSNIIGVRAETGAVQARVLSLNTSLFTFYFRLNITQYLLLLR